jgi:hypothetical protein
MRITERWKDEQLLTVASRRRTVAHATDFILIDPDLTARHERFVGGLDKMGAIDQSHGVRQVRVGRHTKSRLVLVFEGDTDIS